MRVAKFSKAFTEMLANLKEKGYTLHSSKIRFIVAWKGDYDEEETPVLLLNIRLGKRLL